MNRSGRSSSTTPSTSTAGDHAGYASLFADDGVLLAQLGEAVGPAAIQEVLDKNLGPQVRGHLPEAIHVMNNQRIDIDGDTATTVVVWFYLTSDDDGVPTVLQSGRYRDDLVRDNGRMEDQAPRHLAGDGPFADGPSPAHAARRPRCPACRRWRTRTRSGCCSWSTSVTSIRATSRPTHRCSPTTRCGSATSARPSGPARSRTLLVRTLEVYPSDLERTYHLVMNPVIHVDGDTANVQEQLGVHHPQRERPAGVRDARPLQRRAAPHTRRMEVHPPRRLQRHPLHLARRASSDSDRASPESLYPRSPGCANTRGRSID